MDLIDLQRDERGVTTLWLTREDKHNALNAQMMDEITQACTQIAGDGTRVLVLAARGKSFCAGGDLNWMRSQFEATPEVRDTEARRLAGMLRALNDFPVPVVGRIHGNALGGGAGLVSVCDVAVGVSAVKMGFTETRLGLIPATIGPYVVARMGVPVARRVFMSSRVFSAQEARELNLLAKVVEEDALDAAVEAEVAPYLSCAPGAVAEAKAYLRDLTGAVTDEIVDLSVAALAKRWASAEAGDGVGAFFAKESPPWAKKS